MKSQCCNAEVKVAGNTTKYHVCVSCGKPCDVIGLNLKLMTPEEHARERNSAYQYIIP